jgi:hypothetical protein
MGSRCRKGKTRAKAVLAKINPSQLAERIGVWEQGSGLALNPLLAAEVD